MEKKFISNVDRVFPTHFARCRKKIDTKIRSVSDWQVFDKNPEPKIVRFGQSVAP